MVASNTKRLKTVLAYFTNQATARVTSHVIALIGNPGTAPATGPFRSVAKPDVTPTQYPAATHPCIPWATRSGRLAAVLGAVMTLGGCSLAQAPAFFMFGSYFPSWLIGTAVGIVLMIPLRWILIRTGIDDALPLRLLFYVCLVLMITMVFSYTFSPQ